MRRHRIIVVVLAFTVALAGAGCSKSKKPKATGGPTTTTTTVDFCTVARDFVTITQPQLAEDLNAAQTTPGLQDKLREDFQAANMQYADLAASAPEPVKADMDYLANTFDEFVRALESAGYDPVRVAPEAFQKLQEPQYFEASRKVNAYAEQTCGVTPPTTSTTSTTTPSLGLTATTGTGVRRAPTTVRRAPTTTGLVTTTSPPTTSPPATSPPTTSPPTTSPPTTSPPTTSPPTTTDPLDEE